jgi:diguanylate cyclase (GGDEF)-like protein/PAS domain S-box-containing protein
MGVFDDSGRVLEANDALCDLLGYRFCELRGRSFWSLLQPGELTGYGWDAAGIWADQQHTTHGIRAAWYRRGDGASVCCEVSVASSVGEDGRRFWLGAFSDRTEARRQVDALRYRAGHDELTGLPCRSAARKRLAELVAATGETGGGLAVLFCDIDNFKRVNDSLGHDAGDELLVALARRLADGLPGGAQAARLSGDEFLIICSDVGAAGGVDALAGAVTAALGAPVAVRGQMVWASASIGVAVAAGGESEADLLRFADAAMFEAKRRGPGRVTTAGATLIANAEAQLRTESELREALGRDGLRLFYQPVIADDGTILAAEALLRWPHPERGLLSPGEFLPIAARGDLQRQLDRWVLQTALAQAAAWPAVAGRPVSVAVNLAAVTPGEPCFEASVTQAITTSGIDPHRVVLELVETSIVELTSRGRASMQSLTEHGVRFALDDFGTGYSSLARLKDLPAQIIKVDQAFTKGVAADASDRALTRAVVSMARALARSCIAEGVETSRQFHALRDMGLDGYQGWLFSPALPDEEFTELLTAGAIPVPPMR